MAITLSDIKFARYVDDLIADLAGVVRSLDELRAGSQKALTGVCMRYESERERSEYLEQLSAEDLSTLATLHAASLSASLSNEKEKANKDLINFLDTLAIAYRRNKIDEQIERAISVYQARRNELDSRADHAYRDYQETWEGGKPC
jgi:uncharacterized protein YjaG (DUF416 family)